MFARVFLSQKKREALEQVFESQQRSDSLVEGVLVKDQARSPRRGSMGSSAESEDILMLQLTSGKCACAIARKGHFHRRSGPFRLYCEYLSGTWLALLCSHSHIVCVQGFYLPFQRVERGLRVVEDDIVGCSQPGFTRGLARDDRENLVAREAIALHDALDLRVYGAIDHENPIRLHCARPGFNE